MRTPVAALFLAFASQAIAQLDTTTISIDSASSDIATETATTDSSAVDTLALDSTISIDFPPTTLSEYPTSTEAPLDTSATDSASSEFFPGSSSPVGSSSSSSMVPVSYTTTTSYEECDKCETKEHTTTYVTHYAYICPTGLAMSAYTVTETCTGPTPMFSRTQVSEYIPPAFTTTVTVCQVCGPAPTTVTLTVPAPPASTPAPPQPPVTPACYGPGCGTTGPPYPNGNETCPGGAHCPPMCPGGASCPTGAIRPPMQSGPAEYTGAAVTIFSSGWHAAIALFSAVMGGVFFLL